MMHNLFAYILLILLSPIGLMAADSHLTVKAVSGDGIYSMLRRYELDAHTCNFNQFYKLNKLKKNAALYSGKEYKLPIKLYTFNGKTIRSSIGINDWDTAISIQRYNERLTERGIRTAPFKSDKSLWVPHHLIHCPTPDRKVSTPVAINPESAAAQDDGADEVEDVSSGKNRVFPIFGKAYQKVPLNSQKLAGQVYYIVAGHGGPDPGAIGKRGNSSLCEDEYAYDVALRLCRHLVAHGATAYMVNRDANDGIRDEVILPCDRDEVLWGAIKMSPRQKVRLTQRSEVIKDLHKRHELSGAKSQRLVCIHVDSRSKGERTDVFFYHRIGDNKSKSLAQNIQRTFKQKYKQYQAGRSYRGTVSGRDLHMLRETEPPAVYIELANIRNNADQQRIVLAKNRQYLADWLFEGVTKSIK